MKWNPKILVDESGEVVEESYLDEGDIVAEYKLVRTGKVGKTPPPIIWNKK